MEAIPTEKYLNKFQKRSLKSQGIRLSNLIEGTGDCSRTYLAMIDDAARYMSEELNEYVYQIHAEYSVSFSELGYRDSEINGNESEYDPFAELFINKGEAVEKNSDSKSVFTEDEIPF